MINYSKYLPFPKVSGYLKSVCKFIARTLIAVLIIKYGIFTPGRVQGTSMEPNFFRGARFIVNKMPYYFHEPKRYDIVQIIDPENEKKLLIKRVIGMPGEIVTIVNNKIFVTVSDGTQHELEEPYLYDGMITRPAVLGVSRLVVPENHYLLLGDNRLTSRDSREFGAVHRRYINGPIISLYRGAVSRKIELKGSQLD